MVRRAEPARLRSLLGGPPPEQPRGYIEVLAQVLADVLPYTSRTAVTATLASPPCAAPSLVVF